MFFRFLFWLLKPSDGLLRRRSLTLFERVRLSLYRFLLKQLLKTYSHYAISDTILIDGGRIKIVHEYRDPGFENELVRNKIDFKSRMEAVPFPVNERKSKTERHFGYFNFKNLLSLYIDGNELFVKHDGNHSIDGAVKCKVKHAIPVAGISQSVIEVLSSFSAVSAHSAATTLGRERLPLGSTPAKPAVKPKRILKNIFNREKEIQSVTLPDVKPQTPPVAVPANEPSKIEKKGFDIDTSF